MDDAIFKLALVISVIEDVLKLLLLFVLWLLLVPIAIIEWPIFWLLRKL